MARIELVKAQALVAELPGWELHDSTIRRIFLFAGFPEAVAFVVRLAFEAESADHHPDILISYKRVQVTYSTHSAGGLTEKDFDGADAANRIAAALPASGR